MANDAPLLVIVSTGGQAAREHFFQSVAQRYRMWLLLGGAGRSAQATWQHPYLVGASSVDTLDPTAIVEAIAAATAEQGPAAGILTFDEARVESTALAATRLGLPTSSPEAVLRCRDKKLGREALAAAGVPQPASVAVRSLAEAGEVAERFGYPVVLKPRNLAASFGVQLAADPVTLADAYRLARETALPEAPEHYADGVLVEEYLDGAEISVDAACVDGVVTPLVLARKEVGYPPWFEETGHVVDADDPLRGDTEQANAVVDVLARAHRALGITTGITHSEFRLTAAGPKVIEVNARIGGDLIPYLGARATGVDVSLVAADVACGRPPTVHHDRRRTAGVRFYYPDAPLTLDSARFEADLLPGEIDRYGPMAEPGTALSPPPHGFSFTARVAYATAVADSVEACRSALDAAGKALVVRSR